MVNRGGKMYCSGNFTDEILQIIEEIEDDCFPYLQCTLGLCPDTSILTQDSVHCSVQHSSWHHATACQH